MAISVMAIQRYTPLRPGKRRRNLYFERMMAIVAALNLGFVAFDLTYVPWRNFWLQSNVVIPLINRRVHLPLPQMECPNRSVARGQPAEMVRQSVITCVYDPVKGIEPHRDTQEYLSTVDQLQQQVAQRGLAEGLRSVEVQATLLRLRRQSEAMVTLNPFAAANKSGTLERIKNEIRNHVGDRVGAKLGATEAFRIFWSTKDATYPNFLNAATFEQEMSWFNRTLRPLIETNFFRTIGENGEPTNHFWMIDAPFVILFLLEFLARTYYMSNRYRSLTWLDAMVWRWYDIPLFTPFSLFLPTWALLRVIPTTLRLHQARLIDLQALNARVREGFVAAIAEEITEVVTVQMINQLQASLKRGDVANLLAKTTSRRYVDINNINELELISKHLLELILYHVFPKIQPDLESLLRHSVNTVLNQSPLYQGLTTLPGVGSLPGQLTDRLVTDLTQFSYNTVKVILEDPQTTELTLKLVQNFSQTAISEAHQHQNLEEIQSLLSELLEEIKINYVHRLSEEDTTLILDETRQLKQRSRD